MCQNVNYFQATYLEHFERPRQGGRLGGSQWEEDVEKRLPVVLLEHYLLAGLRSLGCRSCRFPLLARVLDQALAPAKEPLGLDKSASETSVAAICLAGAHRWRDVAEAMDEVKTHRRIKFSWWIKFVFKKKKEREGGKHVRVGGELSRSDLPWWSRISPARTPLCGCSWWRTWSCWKGASWQVLLMSNSASDATACSRRCSSPACARRAFHFPRRFPPFLWRSFVCSSWRQTR